MGESIEGARGMALESTAWLDNYLYYCRSVAIELTESKMMREILAPRNPGIVVLQKVCTFGKEPLRMDLCPMRLRIFV